MDLNEEKARGKCLEELKQSGLIRKVEQERDTIEKNTGSCFIIRPGGYFCQISLDEVYFCVCAEKDGCYVSFSDEPSKWEKINPDRITNDEVRKWFDRITRNQSST